MRFACVTLGCKVNQYESAAAAARLREAGLSCATDGPADVLLVNTCAVTETAMRKSRQALRRALREAPGAAVLVFGCYCDVDPQAVQAVLAEAGADPGRSITVGHHGDVAAALRQLLEASPLPPAQYPTGQADRAAWVREGTAGCTGASARGSGGSTSASMKPPRGPAVKANCAGTAGLEGLDCFPGHSRAFLKVQDGCDAFCSYCIIPRARSVLRSRPIEEVRAEAHRLVAAGHREIVLCGIFLGAYGRPTAQRRRWVGAGAPLAELVAAVGAIDGLWRVRLSSLEPLDVTDELIDTLAATKTFSPHLHLPLQSGSPAVLRRMNRQYSPEDFAAAVARVRAAFDRPAVTTDVIVGFPGSSEADFQQTLALLRSAGVSKIHAFPFSPRQGTAAWAWRDQRPPEAVIRQRLAALAALEADLAGRYRCQFVGDVLEGIVEDRPSASVGRAMTDRYITARFPLEGTATPSPGQVVRLAVTGATDEGVAATLTGRVWPGGSGRADRPGL
jgi:threonylcarbamoyladenosine tRNA methylthiotransferase MtaB